MSEDKFENVMRELREAAPPAPDGLRERVSALREPQAKRVWRLRPALVAAAAIALTVGIGRCGSRRPDALDGSRAERPAGRFGESWRRYGGRTTTGRRPRVRP